ncbi:MAG TPA: hypothetical protein VHJ69_00945 [Gemmatimonadales bacterium]|jgi:hypothetical protein|nr:hypothetical protein [Gemmatimonadales bacterium]
MEARIEPLAGTLPHIAWRWDPETDILSGSFKGTRTQTGLTGTVELADDAGSVAVLDVNNGVICGLDVVVWPEVSTLPDLRLPSSLTDGRVILPQRSSRPGVASVEVDATLSVHTNATESLFHIQVGARREADLVRVADHMLIEVDRKGDLAGFWLTDVPPFPAEEELG